MSTELCQILTQRLTDLSNDPMSTDWDIQCTMEKFQAALAGDWPAFYKVTERERMKKDEYIAREKAVQEYLSIGLRRLRNRISENTLELNYLANDLHVLRTHQTDETGISFLLPFDQVKRCLTNIGYYPDSIVDPEESEAMKEYGWRRKLQNYVDTEGRLPL